MIREKPEEDIGNGVPLHKQQPPYKVYIRHHLSPGDVLVLTAAIESIAIQFPGKFRINVETSCPDVWLHNPHIDRSLIASDCHIVHAHYDLINRVSSVNCHFIQGFIEDLGAKFGIPLRAQTNRPHLYLTEEEKKPLIEGDYALINAGVKSDFTAKGAGRVCYQEIVDNLPQIRFVQVGSLEHMHKPLERCENWLGKTTPRELIRLAHGSLFGVGPVTFLHHIYGAIQKPYVCYIGGREQVSWENYPTATMLSTQGQLPCCQTQACWRSRTVPLGDGDKSDTSLCALPVLSGDEYIPGCLHLLGSGPAVWAIRNMILSGAVKLCHPVAEAQTSPSASLDTSKGNECPKTTSSEKTARPVTTSRRKGRNRKSNHPATLPALDSSTGWEMLPCSHTH